MEKNLKKILQITSLVIIAVLAFSFLAFYRPVALFGNTYYEPVFTGSMEPSISVGSVVVIQTMNPADVKVGDVICFRYNENMLVTHRVVAQTDDGLITKGDANDDPDVQAVGLSQVIGKVVFVIPLVGYLGVFVKTPIGLFVLIIFPATALIILELKKVFKKSSNTIQAKYVKR